MKNWYSFLLGLILLQPVMTHAQCGQYPVLELGNDTVLCPGATYPLQVNNTYDQYLWSTGSTLDAITISSAGTYTVEVLNIGTNLVTNGDFESGNTGFTSDYIYGTGGPWGVLSNPGQYAISTSPSNVHSNFSSCADHTSTGPGNMLIANGASTPNVNVWCQTINVTPATDYLFSAWIGNALNDPNVSILQFFINNNQLGNPFSTSVNACNWTEFNETWNSGVSTTAQLCIRNQNTTGGGNDFVLDDITFRPVCIQIDSIHVAYDTLTIDAGQDILFCENETENLQASTNIPGTILTWENGSTGSTFTSTASGTYTVHATSANGCYVEDSADIDITPMPWNIDDVLAGQTSCGSNDGWVSVIMNGSFNVPPIYTWSGPGQGSSSQINASVWQNLGTGWYYISIESDGCYRYDSIEVTPLNPPVAQMSGNPLTGDAPLVVNFTNTSTNGLAFEWNFGNGITLNETTTASTTATYTQPGTYNAFLVVTNGSCTDTAWVTIVVTEPEEPPIVIPPVIVPVSVNVPNVFTPDGDQVNDLFVLDLENITKLDVVIVNRWGNVVFESNSLTTFWDGKTGSGVAATEGVYFYKYTAIGAQNEELKGHGIVQLIRK